MNRLATETSPYLRQHAENPVDWYPWGEEAFAEARRRDVPVFLSVGYSACHWCHVMAHESFEDPATAELVNAHFVCIKVDREERPDVDAIYMEATQAMTGHGGWPMSVWMTPDGEPFYCGTYYPREPRGGMPSFTQVCVALAEAWRDRRGDIAEQATRITEHLRRAPDVDDGTDLPGMDVLDAAVSSLLAAHDPTWGGFGRAPKFPQSMSIDLLLRDHVRVGGQLPLRAALRSLDAMAAGGIHDHLGGGFARYSTDDRWLVPHFEKMLYDNALLLRPYLHAWQLTGRQDLLVVIEGIVGYVLRDLAVDGGGWASAEDADSEGEEGRFYVWSTAEVRTVLGDTLGGGPAEGFIEWYGLTDAGNFEGSNILFRPIGELDRPPEITEAAEALLAHRSSRVRPGLDDKVLTEWNALMTASLAEAAMATGRSDWLDAAVANAEFLLSQLRRDDGRWMRSWQASASGGAGAGGGARHLAYAADLAALVDAFTRLGEATGQRRWIDEATAVAGQLLDLFSDPDQPGFFTTGSDAETLITRPKDLQDGATPSAQSSAAIALLRLSALTGEERWRAPALGILRMLGRLTAEHPLAFANLSLAVELEAGGTTEVVVVGDRPDLVEEMWQPWLPTAVRSWGEPLDGPLWQERPDGAAYVCRSFTCGLPANDRAALAEQLDGTVPRRRDTD